MKYVRICGERVSTDTTMFTLSGESVKDLSDLKKLPRLKYLTLDAVAVTDFAPLAQLPHLTELFVRQCPGLIDMGALASLTRLEHLDIEGCPVSDLGPVSRLKTLRQLTLVSEHVVSLEGIRCLPCLDALTLICNISSTEGLVDLPALRELSLQNCYQLESLEGILALKSLVELDVSFSSLGSDRGKLKCLPDMSGLKRLRAVVIENSSISNIDGLSGSKVHSLTLCNVDVTHLDVLADMEKLERLLLEECEYLGGLDALAECQLKSLSLRGSPVGNASIGAISGMSSLMKLDLSETNITEVDALVGLSKLKALYVDKTRIVDISPLNYQRMKSLIVYDYEPPTCWIGGERHLLGEKRMRLSGEGVCESDLAQLSMFPMLEHLSIVGCPNIKDLGSLPEMKSLKTLTITACPGITSIEPLSKQIGLFQLFLTECPGITSIEPLEWMSIECLGLLECPSITSIEPVTCLPLRMLHISGIPLASLDCLRGAGVCAHIYGMGFNGKSDD